MKKNLLIFILFIVILSLLIKGFIVYNQRYILFCEYILQDEGFVEKLSINYPEPDEFFKENSYFINKIIFTTFFSEEKFFIKLNRHIFL